MSDTPENTPVDETADPPVEVKLPPTQKFDPTHQQIDPANANDPGTTTIYLPNLIADEFGMDRSLARMLVSTGKITLLESGDKPEEEIDGRQLDFPVKKLAGRVIRIESDPNMQAQSVQFLYKG